MSVDLSGEVTAIATAVLAFFAIVTAVFAFLACLKEKQAVSILLQENHEHQQAMERDAAEHHQEQASRVWVMMVPDDNAAKRDFPANRPVRKPAEANVADPSLKVLVMNTSEHQVPIFQAKLHWYHGSEPFGDRNCCATYPGTRIRRDPAPSARHRPVYLRSSLHLPRRRRLRLDARTGQYPHGTSSRRAGCRRDRGHQGSRKGKLAAVILIMSAPCRPVARKDPEERRIQRKVSPARTEARSDRARSVRSLDNGGPHGCREECDGTTSGT
jgi:hypothetical protein